VIDGARTRDNQNHNLALYQLNYDHHIKVLFLAWCGAFGQEKPV